MAKNVAADVRESLVAALEADLVGPRAGATEHRGPPSYAKRFALRSGCVQRAVRAAGLALVSGELSSERATRMRKRTPCKR